VIAVEQHISDVRALVRWWVVGFAAMASTAIGGLSAFETDSLRPWAQALWVGLLVAGFAIASGVLLGVAKVFQLPKDWFELSVEDRAESAAFGAGPDQLAMWDRSTADRHRADDVRQRVVAAVRLRECGVAMRGVTWRLRIAGAAVLAIVVALVLIREVGREHGAVCRAPAISCASLPVTRPMQVTVRLAADSRGNVTAAARALATQLGGGECSPAARFDAVATGGDLTRPILVADLPGCATARFLLDPNVGVAIPAAT
jgi:hypothetical protein